MFGRVQHGEQILTPNGTTRAKELGHFIAKIQDDYMKDFLQKFDSLYKGKKYIEIEFFNDNPLTKKFVRYNQSGDVCHCLEGQTTGSQKTKNGWQPIECNIEKCQYRQKNAAGKTACNRIGWLKFLIPDVCQDRIWLMRITGQTSINRIDAYINLQKAQGNPINGRYILFLRQEEQECKSTGQKFTNYILDILKKDNFIQTKQNPQTTEESKKLSTVNEQNVNNNIETKPFTEVQETTKNTTTHETQSENKSEKSTKKTTKTQKSKTKKQSQNETPSEKTQETQNTNSESTTLDDCYMLVSTYTQKIKQKTGEDKEYLMAEFYNMEDKQFNVAIKPEDSNELLQCDVGTIAKLNLKTINDIHFALNIEYVDKHIKNIAA